LFFRLQLDIERLPCQALLVSSFGVARYLRERAMAGDCLDLVDATSGISEPRCRRFSPF
jgi:hypothetical protein